MDFLNCPSSANIDECAGKLMDSTYESYEEYMTAYDDLRILFRKLLFVHHILVPKDTIIIKKITDLQSSVMTKLNKVIFVCNELYKTILIEYDEIYTELLYEHMYNKTQPKHNNTLFEQIITRQQFIADKHGKNNFLEYECTPEIIKIYDKMINIDAYSLLNIPIFAKVDLSTIVKTFDDYVQFMNKNILNNLGIELIIVDNTTKMWKTNIMRGLVQELITCKLLGEIYFDIINCEQRAHMRHLDSKPIKRCFIFGNAIAINKDLLLGSRVCVLSHELGHAISFILSKANLPYATNYNFVEIFSLLFEIYTSKMLRIEIYSRIYKEYFVYDLEIAKHKSVKEIVNSISKKYPGPFSISTYENQVDILSSYFSPQKHIDYHVSMFIAIKIFEQLMLNKENFSKMKHILIEQTDSNDYLGQLKVFFGYDIFDF